MSEFENNPEELSENRNPENVSPTENTETYNASNPNGENAYNAAGADSQNTWNAVNPNQQNTWNAANPNQQNTWNAADPNQQNTWNAADPNQQNTWNAANPYGDGTPLVYNVNQKKKKPVWAFVLLGVAAIAIICTALVLFVPTIRNTFDLITLSPASYYKKIETRNIDKKIDEFTLGLKEYSKLSNEDLSYTFEETMIFGDLYRSLLFEGREETVELNEVGLKGTYNKKGSLFGMNANIAINKSSMANLDIYIDENHVIYARVPEISENYISVDIKDIIKSNMTANLYSLPDSDSSEESLKIMEEVMGNLSNAEIDYDLLNSILKRYAAISIENAGKVNLEKNVTLSDDYLKAKTTKITITLTEKDFYNLVLKIVETMKDDGEVFDFVNKIYPVTKEQYDSLFDELLSSLKETDASELDTEEEIKLIVWTDSSGAVVGRGIEADGYTLSAVNISNKNEMGCQLKLSGGKDNVSFTIGGLLEKKGDSYNGTLSISAGAQGANLNIGEIVVNSYYYKNSKDYDIDAQLVIKESTLKLMLGESGLPEGFEGDIHLSMKSSSKDNKYTMSYAYGFGAPDNFMSVSVSGETGEANDITIPSDAFKLPDEIEEYQKTLNLENLIRSLGAALGVSEEEINDAVETFQDTGYVGGSLGNVNPGSDSPTSQDGDEDPFDIDTGDSSIGDDDSGYTDDSGDMANEVPTEIPTSEDQLPAGVSADSDSGYYSYKVTKEAVEKAGLADDNDHFELTYDDVESKLINILSEYIGEVSVIDEKSENTINGIIDDSYPYRYFSFVTSKQLGNNDNAYKNFITVNYDTANKKIENIVIKTDNANDCDSITAKVISVLEPGFGDGDIEKIKKDIEASDFGFADYKSLSIYYFSIGDDYNTYTISPSGQ